MALLLFGTLARRGREKAPAGAGREGDGSIKIKINWELKADDGKLTSLTVNGDEYPIGLECEAVKVVLMTVANKKAFQTFWQDIRLPPKSIQ